MICVSVVSHGHGVMVEALVKRLLEFPEVAQVVLTRNIAEQEVALTDTRLFVINNAAPKGFGANHNAAFIRCDSPFFCVLNPDIHLPANPFPALLRGVTTSLAAMAAPQILTPAGEVDDSVRVFPTLWGLLRKAMFKDRGRVAAKAPASAVFWVAGMFMLWRREAFAQLGGFDEGFFLYYEDVDICARAWKSGLTLVVCEGVSAIHDARRESHRNLRFMRWHAASMVRYLRKHSVRQPRR